MRWVVGGRGALWVISGALWLALVFQRL